MFYKQKRIYFDHAATTPVDRRVIKAMQPFWREKFGNPGGLHKEGVEAREAVEDARKKIADFLHAHSYEIIFTSGGTEANNLAIFGFVKMLEEQGIKPSGVHLITSAIEHPSVLDVFGELEKRGAKVSYIPVGTEGIVQVDELKKALQPNTVLVSVMYANNEIGTIQPIQDIAKIIRRHRKKTEELKNLRTKESKDEKAVHQFISSSVNKALPVFHVDACQAPLFLDINVERLGVDLLTVDSQKMYGPKGVGGLYVRRGVEFKPLFCGGNQEQGLRPGTQNVSGIVGFAKAFEIADKEREKEAERLTKLQDYFIEELQSRFPNIILNGSREHRLPNNVNISVLGIESELLVLELDARGIAVSARSACKGDDIDESYVIRALRPKICEEEGSLRFTFGRSTTKHDLDYALRALEQILRKYSKIS